MALEQKTDLQRLVGSFSSVAKIDGSRFGIVPDTDDNREILDNNYPIVSISGAGNEGLIVQVDMSLLAGNDTGATIALDNMTKDLPLSGYGELSWSKVGSTPAPGE